MFEEIERSPTLQFFSAVLTFFLGLVIVLVTPGGERLSTVVTLIGWIELVEGLTIFVAPGLVFGTGRRLTYLGRGLYAGISIAGLGLITAGLFAI